MTEISRGERGCQVICMQPDMFLLIFAEEPTLCPLINQIHSVVVV